MENSIIYQDSGREKMYFMGLNPEGLAKWSLNKVDAVLFNDDTKLDDTLDVLFDLQPSADISADFEEFV